MAIGQKSANYRWLTPSQVMWWRNSPEKSCSTG